MLKRRKIKDMKTSALKSCGIELSSPEISFLSLGNYLMDFRGRRTLKALKPFIGRLGMFVISVSPANTTVKSSQFHPSLK